MVLCNVRNYRIKSGMSIQELADKVGITQSYMSRIELGQQVPNYETMCRLSQILDAGVEELFECEEVE